MARRKKLTTEMAENGLSVDPQPDPNGEAAMHSSGSASHNLEERMRRLEDALATLQDTKPLEDRVTERVVQRIRASTPRSQEVIPASAPPAPRALLPATFPVPSSEPQASAAPRFNRTWLVLDILSDARTIVRMYLDRRFPMSWLGRMMPLIAITIIVLSWLFLSSIWIIGPAVDRILDLVVAFIFYKVATRELVVYRQMFPDQSGFRLF